MLMDRDLTDIVQKAGAGDIAAREQVIRALYPQLQAMARKRLSAHQAPTLLDTVGLLHDSIAKLIEGGLDRFQNTRHIVAYTATIMRTILVDYARERNALKRDFGERVEITNLEIGTKDRAVDLIMLDQALTKLAEVEPRLSKIVEMRCFGGLQLEEIAAELQVSDRTIKRDWQKARAFLSMFLEPT
jgi:RNA polymerase sigma factor (TIGR02999 family)